MARRSECAAANTAQRAQYLDQTVNKLNQNSEKDSGPATYCIRNQSCKDTSCLLNQFPFREMLSNGDERPSEGFFTRSVSGK